MDEPKVPPPLIIPRRGAWITRNKRLLSGVAIGGLLLLFAFGHHSTVQQQVDQQNQEREKAAREEAKRAAAAGHRVKPEDLQDDDSTRKQGIAGDKGGASGGGGTATPPEKSDIEKQREKLKYDSLFKFNVSETKQAPEAPKQEPHLEQASDKKAEPQKAAIPDCNDAGGLGFVLPEGTMIEAELLNKLDGSMDGAADAQVRTDLYYPRTRVLLLPQGTRFLGGARRIEAFGQQRLAVMYHRIVVFKDDPLATCSIPLDKEPASDQQGTPGLGGKVNNHILSSLGIAGAIGAIAGLAQLNNGYSGYGYDPGVEMRVGMTQSMSQSSMRILDRFLNRMPNIEIQPGTRVNIRLNQDTRIPAVQEVKADESIHR